MFLPYLEHPVDARCGEKANSVIDNDMVVIRDAELANLLCELRSGGHHVWKAAGLVLDGFDIKVPGYVKKIDKTIASVCIARHFISWGYSLLLIVVSPFFYLQGCVHPHGTP